MPRGAAGHDDHALSRQQLAAVVYQRRERHVVGLYVHAASHAVGQAFGLLKNLLQHEVRIAPFLYLAQVNIDGLHVQFLRLVLDAHHPQLLAATDDGDVAVL